MINTVKKIMPRSLKEKLVGKVKNLYNIKNKDYSKFHLPQKYIDNVKLLANRTDMLHYMPKNAKIAEIGVHRGMFSQEIMKITSPEYFVLIDIWDTAMQPNADNNIKFVRETFAKEIENKTVKVVRGDGAKSIGMEADQYFDWIYIDAEHSYNSVYRELRAVLPKIKTNGIICGHDYNDCYMPALCQYGVVEAVNEFCMEFNFEFKYLTNEPDRALSWAIKKI